MSTQDTTTKTEAVNRKNTKATKNRAKAKQAATQKKVPKATKAEGAGGKQRSSSRAVGIILVWRWLLHALDHPNFHFSFYVLQLQPDLFMKGNSNGRTR